MKGEVQKAYEGSDADVTRALYARLEAMAPRGPVAMNLLRLMKASGRAKQYRGRPSRGRQSYRSMAYDKKDWAIGVTIDALRIHAEDCGIEWGWGFDKKAIGYEHVLYVELPGAGQVSFHTHYRRDGPDHPREWDGQRNSSALRIIEWAQAVLDGRDCTLKEEEHGTPGRRGEGEAAAAVEGAAAQPERQESLLD